jgi:hypothetical protein
MYVCHTDTRISIRKAQAVDGKQSTCTWWSLDHQCLPNYASACQRQAWHQFMNYINEIAQLSNNCITDNPLNNSITVSSNTLSRGETI